LPFKVYHERGTFSVPPLSSEGFFCFKRWCVELRGLQILK